MTTAYKLVKAPRKASWEGEGTAGAGGVVTSYAKLVSRFGKPFGKSVDKKVDAEWVLRTKVGGTPIVVTIYNYKDGKAYNGPSGLPLSKIRNWHIGGSIGKGITGAKIVAIVKAALK